MGNNCYGWMPRTHFKSFLLPDSFEDFVLKKYAMLFWRRLSGGKRLYLQVLEFEYHRRDNGGYGGCYEGGGGGGNGGVGCRLIRTPVGVMVALMTQKILTHINLDPTPV